MTTRTRPVPPAALVADCAADLIAWGWTQESFARTARGKVVSSHDPRACRWCAEGSIYAAAAALVSGPQPVLKVLSVVIGHEWIAGWNDAPERTADDVVRALRETARRLAG